jgi:type I restriction enzyme S subunit
MRFDEGGTPLREVLSEGLRNGLTRPSNVRGEGVKMINMGELFAERRIAAMPMERVALAERNPERDLLAANDLLFARQSLVAEGAGQVSIFLGDNEPVTFESHLIRARVDPDKADPRFIFYFFESPHGRAAIWAIVDQTSAAGIRGKDLARVHVPALPLKRQRRIADALEAFDQKIEANREACRTIDALVKTEFRRTCLDPKVAEDDEAAWDEIALSELGGPTSVRALAGDAAGDYIAMDHMPRESTILAEWDSRTVASAPTTRFAAGDILFGKLRPYFRKVGVACTAGRCSTEVLALRPSRPEYWGILLGHLTTERFFEHCHAVSTGTKMPRAEWRSVGTLRVQVPSTSDCEAFTAFARAQFDLVCALIHESRALQRLRDSLMPRLIAGALLEVEQALAANDRPAVAEDVADQNRYADLPVPDPVT